MKHLDERVLEDIKRRVVEEIRPVRVYLFGSHAWGTPDRDSDVDILLVVEHLNGGRSDVLRRAYHCVGDLRIPAEFVVKTEAEMQRFTRVPASLANKVVNQGIRLYG